MPDSAHPDTTLILAAIAGELSSEEMDSIKIRRAKDPDFEAMYRSCELEIAILKASDRVAVKESLKQELQGSYQRTIPLWTWPVGLAAALLALFLLFREDPNAQSLPELALSYVEPVSAGQIRGDQSSEEGILAYQNKEYQTAIDFWQINDSLTNNQKLLLGSAYLQAGTYDLAVKAFAELQHISPYQDIAGWNLALSFLLNDQPEKARPLLEEIAGSSHYRQTEASLLLNKIR